MIEATDNNPRASEAGHWYNKQGVPVYEVMRADGKGMRPTTLRDARKLKLAPGVSTVNGVLDKPGLNRWKAKNLLLAGLTLPRREFESEDVWFERVYKDADEQSRKARERGTAIHTAVEGAYRGEQFGEEFALEIQSTVALLTQISPSTHWYPETAFYHPLGYGGKIDLLGLEHGNEERGLITVVDFKTTKFSKEEIGIKVFGWDEHLLQLAAYGAGACPAGDRRLRLLNIYISSNNPGLAVPREWDPIECARAEKSFFALLQYWKTSRNYDPTEE